MPVCRECFPVLKPAADRFLEFVAAFVSAGRPAGLPSGAWPAVVSVRPPPGPAGFSGC